MNDFLFGIEHEIALLRPDQQFADFTNTRFAELQAVVEQLPRYPEDAGWLRLGDAGIKVKRWYVDAFERYHEDGSFWICLPKGLELRTPPRPTIRETISELIQNYRRLVAALEPTGFRTTWVSYHPFQRAFVPDPPLNVYEQRRRQSPEDQTAAITIVTYGPDLNCSLAGQTDAELIDGGEKLTAYSPMMVPFSFSSPFFNGQLWEGLSVRTFIRTGPRPAAMVFVHDPDHHTQTWPSLTQVARIPRERGRIEFKAFDTCRDPGLYAALLALLKGLILDRTLPKRARVPDRASHQRSARLGFDAPDIREGAAQLLAAAGRALAADPDRHFLEPLHQALVERRTPAHTLREEYQRTGSILATLQRYANLAV